MMKVYFVRHGETEANAKKMHQYSNDPLSAKGKRQINSLAKKLTDIKIDIILSSPFERARQTSEIINKRLNTAVEYDEVLREIKRPSEIEGKHIQDEEAVRIKDIIAKNAHNPKFWYSDEENFLDFRKRVITILKKLSKREEENILVVTHGEVIFMIKCITAFDSKLTSDQHYNLKSQHRINNSEVTIFNYENNSWSLSIENDLEKLEV